MKYMRLALICLTAALVCALGQAPQPPAANAGTQLVVTAVPQGGGAEPIQQAQVEVKQGSHKLTIEHWAPYTANDRLDLALAIDEDTHGLNSALDDVKNFVAGLPANVAVGIVYFHTGSFAVAENFTMDHKAAAAAIRLPSGSASSSPSPYGSLSALIEHWPSHPGVRREVIMISDGEEHAGGNDANNRALQQALGEAVARNVVVYTIYAAGNEDNSAHGVDNTQLVPDMAGADPSQKQADTPLTVFRNSNIDQANGNNNLSQLSKATGGESYSQGITTGSRMTSYFTDISRRLAAQYSLVVLPYLSDDHGVVGVKVKVNHADAKITAPEKIYIARQP